MKNFCLIDLGSRTHNTLLLGLLFNLGSMNSIQCLFAWDLSLGFYRWYSG